MTKHLSVQAGDGKLRGSHRLLVMLGPVTSALLATMTQPATAGPVEDAFAGIARTPPEAVMGVSIAEVCLSGRAGEPLQRDCDALAGAALSPDAGTRSQASNALGQVTPDQANGAVDESRTSVAAQLRNIGQRLAALRGGATGISAQGLTMEDGDLMYGRHYAGIASAGGAASADEAGLGRLGMFVNGTLLTGQKDATENEAGFDFDGGNITFGTDYRFTDELVLGAALGYTRINNDLDANGGKLDNDGWGLTLYGTYYPSESFYVDGVLSFANTDFDQERNIDYDIPSATVRQTAKASFGGDQRAFSLSAGYNFNRGALSYGPTARLQYLDASVDGYREHTDSPATVDGSGWTLAVDSQDYESLTTNLGGQVSYASSKSWGVLVPQARLEWVHEFKDDTRFVSASFTHDSGHAVFRIPTDSPDQDYVTLALGVSALLARGRTAYFSYQTVLGLDSISYHALNAGIRWEF